MYTFHVTFDDHAVDGVAALHQLAARFRGVLSGVGGLDMVPDEWLHLTVQGIGFTDEVAEPEAQAILAAARTRCARLAHVTLQLGPPVVFREGVSLPGSPPEPAAELRDALRAAIADVRGDADVSESTSFSPHVTLAYSNTTGSGHNLTRAVEAWSPDPVSVTVKAASLIILNRDARMYRWRHYAYVPLKH